MPTIDFYLLSTTNQEETYRFLCRLIDKAYQQQLYAYIHTHSLEEAHYVDDLLWTFRDISFIPHQLGELSSTQIPVSVFIGMDKPISFPTDILFNFAAEVPLFFSEFTRVIEIVSEEATNKLQARKKYKAYKEQNCPLTTHHISLPC
jgi:DNA polymerase III subunit chi